MLRLRQNLRCPVVIARSDLISPAVRQTVAIYYPGVAKPGPWAKSRVGLGPLADVYNGMRRRLPRLGADSLGQRVYDVGHLAREVQRWPATPRGG